MNSSITKKQENANEHVSTDNSNDKASSSPSKLATLNILNFVFYLINIILTYGIGTANWIGESTSNGELSRKYQTIVTPKSAAFSIWGLIFVSQAIFALVQLLPKFRGHPMIIDGVGYWYILVCISQVGWTFAFSFEQIPLSLVFMIAIWSFLMRLLYSQFNTQSDSTLSEFWLMRFPFAIHAGWITAASAVNTSVVSVWNEDSAAVQLTVAIVSLAVLHAVSVWVIFVIDRPNYTIACVISWANFWIYGELSKPMEIITETFGNITVNGVKNASLSVCIIILGQIVGHCLSSLIHGFRKKSQNNMNGIETSPV